MPESRRATFRFPLKDVDIVTTTEKRTLSKPTFTDQYSSISQWEFTLDIEEIAFFYVRGGNYIEVVPYQESTFLLIELYLNGSVYGAILHQRKIMPLHGSSFQYCGEGVMICGESGAGKSSITASFCLNGADFLTDDVTPVVFNDKEPHVWAMSDRIKLHSDSLEQLNQEKEGLIQVGPAWKKFYLPMESGDEKKIHLHHIFVIQIHDEPEINFQQLSSIESFTILRNEIYRSEYLRGMPESESAYLTELILMVKAVTITKILRPVRIPIDELQKSIKEYILSTKATKSRYLA